MNPIDVNPLGFSDLFLFSISTNSLIYQLESIDFEKKERFSY